MAQTPRHTPSAAGAASWSIDAPEIRSAGRDLLSLALIDARNHTLHLLTLYEEALGSEALAVPPVPEEEGVVPPVWLAGHIG